MKKAVLFWSGGKDSALALHRIKKENQFQIVSLITTINKNSNRVPFHGINEKQIVLQAKLLGLPLLRVYLPNQASNEDYESKVGGILESFKKKGITDFIFGDIFLKDIREYRENFLSRYGLAAHFPLWESNSTDLIKEFEETGHKAVITAVLKEKLEEKYLNKELSLEYVKNLPVGVDHAGENGEYHSFVYYSPYFKMRVSFSKDVGRDEGPYLVSNIREP
ncbi:MAG: diphthine--ammonia ligase [Oligoflexia bacterium]|nr:diphthine--ammonia ligase [Oligoflexia bacterium]